MNLKSSSAENAVRFAILVAALDIALMCATLGLSWVLRALLPCRLVHDIDLSCRVLGVEWVGLKQGADLAAWLWVPAQLLFILVIMLALVFAASEWIRSRIKARSS